MLYVHEKVAKLGGVYLGGQVSSVEVTEEASIYVPKDDKGKTKKTQPVGYENAKVSIEIILEDTKKATSLEQLANMQRLFKSSSAQNTPRMLEIVNEDCAARGITQVYFKTLTSKKVISESILIASLELIAPKIANIKVIKKVSKKKKKANKKTSKNKSKKDKNKSPAKDSRNTAKGKKAAKSVLK